MSKNLQIKWSFLFDDLSSAGVKSAIANLKKIADAGVKYNISSAKKIADVQKKIDRDLILNRNSVRQQIDSLKAAQKLVKFSKEQQKIQNKTFDIDKKYYKAKIENMQKQWGIMQKIHSSELMLGNAIKNNNKEKEAYKYKNWTRRGRKMWEMGEDGGTERGEEMYRKGPIRTQQKEKQRNTLREDLGYIAIGAGAGALLYKGIEPLTYSFGKTMQAEQQQIALRGQFGKVDGNKVYEEMKKFTMETTYTLDETIQLLLGVNKGAKNLGLKTIEEKIALTKALGRPLIALSTDKENRARAGYQLSQIMMFGKANEMQDIAPITKAGIPIYNALSEMTGKPVQELKDKYGSQLPASLLIKSMLYLNSSEGVVNAMKELEKSLTLGAEQVREQTGFTAGTFGKTISDTLKLPKLLNTLTDRLKDVENLLKTDKNNKLSTGQQISGTAAATGVGALGLATLYGLYKGADRASQFFFKRSAMSFLSLKSLTSLTKGFAGLYGIVSGISLIFADWNSLFDNVNKNGFAGLKDNLSEIIQMVAFLGGAFLTGGWIPFLLGGGLLVLLKKYKEMQYDASFSDYNKAIDKLNAGKFTNYYDYYNSTVRKNQDGIATNREELFKNFYGRPQIKPEINLQQIINVDKSGNVQTETKVRDILSNSLYSPI